MTSTTNPIPYWNGDEWRARAACRHTEVELFFPIEESGTAPEQTAAAKEFCRSCPVQEPCLLFALQTNQDFGIWGGKSEDERRRLRRRMGLRRRPA